VDPTLTTPIADWVAERFYWAMIIILIINLMQRRHQDQAAKKRFATLYLAIATFIIYVAAEMVRNYGMTDFVFIAIAIAVVVVLVVYRAHTFPFRFRSTRDRRWHTFNEILFDDEHGDGDRSDATDPAETEPEDSGREETEPDD